MMPDDTRLRKKALPRVLLFLLLLFIIVDFAPIYPVKPFRSVEFKNVINMIKNGTLKSDPHGVIVLPSNLAYITPTGHIYVSKDAKGAMIVFFPSWIGRRTLNEYSLFADRNCWLQGYVYDSRRSNLTHSLDDYDGWSLNAPSQTMKWNSKKDGQISESTIYADHQIQSHWFYAIMSGP